MKRAAKATRGYAETFRRLTADGWALRNYGDGWRYFTREVKDVEPDAAGMKLYQCCRVSAADGGVEELPSQRIA